MITRTIVSPSYCLQFNFPQALKPWIDFPNERCWDGAVFNAAVVTLHLFRAMVSSSSHQQPIHLAAVVHASFAPLFIVPSSLFWQQISEYQLLSCGEDDMMSPSSSSSSSPSSSSSSSTSSSTSCDTITSLFILSGIYIHRGLQRSRNFSYAYRHTTPEAAAAAPGDDSIFEQQLVWILAAEWCSAFGRALDYHEQQQQRQNEYNAGVLARLPAWMVEVCACSTMLHSCRVYYHIRHFITGCVFCHRHCFEPSQWFLLLRFFSISHWFGRIESVTDFLSSSSSSFFSSSSPSSSHTIVFTYHRLHNHTRFLHPLLDVVCKCNSSSSIKLSLFCPVHHRTSVLNAPLFWNVNCNHVTLSHECQAMFLCFPFKHFLILIFDSIFFEFTTVVFVRVCVCCAHCSLLLLQA